MKNKVIIDCDPGHDDAVALVLATRADIELLGVSVVAGNSTLSHTVRNALNVLAFAGAGDVPVYAGCEKPLRHALQNASGEQIHGADGLGNWNFETPTRQPEDEHAVDFLIRTLRDTSEKITLVCLGPLTNIATAFTRAPECKQRVERLIMMGGAVRVSGNVTPTAEFNFYSDPDAAKIVMESGCELCLIPLDVTMKALFYKEDIARLKEADNELSQFVGGLLSLYADNYTKELGFYACPVHDALCVCVLMEQGLLRYEETKIEIVTDGAETGKSTPDRGKGACVRYGSDIDREAFVALIERAVLKPRIKTS